MRSSDYWERRQIEDAFQYFQKAEDTADQISRLYRKASRYLATEADAIFEKYQTKHGLSESEARRLINTLRDKGSLDELLQKLKNGDKDEPKKELLAKLEAPAYQARLDRLQRLQNQLDFILRDVCQQEKDFHTSFYTDLAKEAYYRSVFQIQQRTESAFSFEHVSANIIDTVINSRWSGKNYSERIWGNTQELAQTLKEELLINLVTGRTNREAAEIIANRFGQGASSARRLVRTESNYVCTELNFKAYKECAIEKYQYLATLDLKTSLVCRDLDGKMFPVKDKQTGKNCPPMHPWCRSTTISVVDEEYISKMQRAAIDPATGERIKVPRTMSYWQWYDKYVRGKPEVELEEKKTKNRSADRTQYQKYKKILGGDVPETLDKFQNMKYNEPEKWELFKAYKRSVKNGMISPLSGFKNYLKLYNGVNEKIVGIETLTGTKITGQSRHFMERVIGTMKDPKTGRSRSGVSIEELAEALKNPIKVQQMKTRKDGEKSQRYYGKAATVTINPENGNLIQCNPTDSDLVRRLKNAARHEKI